MLVQLDRHVLAVVGLGVEAQHVLDAGLQADAGLVELDVAARVAYRHLRRLAARPAHCAEGGAAVAVEAPACRAGGEVAIDHQVTDNAMSTSRKRKPPMSIATNTYKWPHTCMIRLVCRSC